MKDINNKLIHYNSHYSVFIFFANEELIPVVFWFVWSIFLDTDILCLIISEDCELCTDTLQVKACYLFIEMFWEAVDSHWI